jgi:hypothetical protein
MGSTDRDTESSQGLLRGESSEVVHRARNPRSLSQTLPAEHPAKRTDWLKLWFATQRVPWRSLALVPAGKMPPDFTVEIAVSLVQIGAMHLGSPIRIADGTGVPLNQLAQFMSELEAVQQSEDPVLIALGPTRENPTTVSLARAADAVLLCVPLGQTTTREAKRTLDEIGRDRFIGSAAFHI